MYHKTEFKCTQCKQGVLYWQEWTADHKRYVCKDVCGNYFVVNKTLEDVVLESLKKKNTRDN